MKRTDIKKFQQERDELNELVMKHAGLQIKRFFNIDAHVYHSGALPVKYKELMGLVASLVLRCDDCLKYHLTRCHDEGVSDTELEETLAIGLIVGGSITIPHLRKTFRAWEELNS